MPSQVVGIIEASSYLSEAGWRTLTEPTGEWQIPSVEEIEADLGRLQADLKKEWSQLRQQLYNL